MTSPGCSYSFLARTDRGAGCYWAGGGKTAVAGADVADVVVVVVVVLAVALLHSPAALFCINSSSEPLAWNNSGIYRNFQGGLCWHRGIWDHLLGD